MPEIYRCPVSFPVVPSTGGVAYAADGTTLAITAVGTAGQVLTSQGAGAPIWSAGASVTPAALTRVDDTNVTVTLGGTPSTALLQATSLTMGWSGQLSLARGGTNANLTAVNGGAVYSTATAFGITAAGSVGQVLTSQGAAPPIWSGVSVTPAALTRVDDTNVTLTLGGTPSTALLQATSLTLGWTGQLSLARGGTNANLTAVNGGAVYSTATAFGITAAGTTGQVLVSQGAAAPIWATAGSATAAGVDTDVQFNDGGVFGADSGAFTYTKATNTLNVSTIWSQSTVSLTLRTTPAPVGVGNHSEPILISTGDNGNTAGLTGAITIRTGSPTTANTNGINAITIDHGTMLDQAGFASTGNTGGIIHVIAGTGQSVSGNFSTGGLGGAMNLTAGTGGVNSFANGNAGAGGVMTVKSGAGGNATHADATNGGAGGALNLLAQAGGTAAQGTGGVGGAASLTAGAGGNATGGSGTRNGGNGGNVTIGSGAGGTGASANGTTGTITMNAGATQAAVINTTSFTFAITPRLTPIAFASLPTGAEGMIAAITDSNTATWGATIAGGGANNVLGFYNGANWTVAAA